MSLHALAPGKVNLCLCLGALREDGRHELVTLIESVSLADELSMVTLGKGDDEVVCPGVEGRNLASSALAALREKGWGAPPVRLEIRKQIPIAGGMAGGSADAAAALRMAMELAPLPDDEVAQVACALGSDVRSQLAPGLVLGRGGGEIVEPLEPLVPHALLLLPQQLALLTADVYREADRLGISRSRGELQSFSEELLSALGRGAGLPEHLLVNDLQPASLSLCPAIGEALKAARAAGAEQALVCGSGPTVAGLYWGTEAQARATAAARALAADFPGACAAAPVAEGFGSPVAVSGRLGNAAPSPHSGTI